MKTTSTKNENGFKEKNEDDLKIYLFLNEDNLKKERKKMTSKINKNEEDLKKNKKWRQPQKKIKNEDDLKKNEDDLKKNEYDLKKKSTLIGCKIIVN